MFKNKMEGKKMILLNKFISIFAGIFIFSSVLSQEKPKIHMLA